jgi:hypothetical protein
MIIKQCLRVPVGSEQVLRPPSTLEYNFTTKDIQ